MRSDTQSGDMGELGMNVRAFARVTGHAGTITDAAGRPMQLVSIEPETERIELHLPGAALRTSRLPFKGRDTLN